MLPLGLVTRRERQGARREREGEVPGARTRLDAVLEREQARRLPYTPADASAVRAREALAVLEEEGLEQVFARHARAGAGVPRAVQALGL